MSVIFLPERKIWTSQPQVPVRSSSIAAWNFANDAEANSGILAVRNTSYVSRSVSNGMIGASVSGSAVLDRYVLGHTIQQVNIGSSDFTVCVTFAYSTSISAYSVLGRWNTGASASTCDWFLGAPSTFNNSTAGFTVACGSVLYTASCANSWVSENVYTLIGRRRGTTISINVYNHSTGTSAYGETTNAGITTVNFNASRKTKLGEIDAGAVYNLTATYYLASTENRSISDAEVIDRASLSKRWQIFAPVNRPIFVDLGAGGPATYNDSFTEALTAADSFVTSAIFGNTFSESITASDSDAGSLSIAESIAEALAAADSILVSTTYTDTLNEGLTATESLASIQTILETVAESVTADYSQSDSQSGPSGTTYNETHTASVTADFTAVSIQTFVEALSEALTVAAAYTDNTTYQEALTEAVSALDSYAVNDGSTTLTQADIAAIVAAIFAQAQVTPIHSNMMQTNNEALIGDGTEGNKFRSHLVP